MGTVRQLLSTQIHLISRITLKGLNFPHLADVPSAIILFKPDDQLVRRASSGPIEELKALLSSLWIKDSGL